MNSIKTSRLSAALFLVFTSFMVQSAIESGFLSYNKTSATQVAVTYHLQTEQTDSNFSASDFTSSLLCTSSSASITITAIQKIAATKVYHGCSQTNYSWHYQFEALIDLNSSQFVSLASCGVLTIDLSGSTRVSGISNLTSSTSDFYIYSSFSNTATSTNKSPESLFNTYANNCLNQSYYLNLAMLDDTDFDSLSFELVSPLSSLTAAVAFKSGLSATLPLNAYFPSGKVHPYAEPASVPAIGFHLSVETGDIVYTPVNATEKGPVVVEVNEWRKDGSGTYQKIGTMHREIMVQTTQCPQNNPPEVDGLYTYTAAENKLLCFDITTDDITFIPPPPGLKAQDDSVRISWNHAIPSATFNIINPKALHQTGRFCWTPATGAASPLPYTFTVTARDNSCPLNAITKRSFRVIVKEFASISSLDKNILLVYPNPATNVIELNQEMTSAAIINSIGKEVKSLINIKKIDISELPQGVYFITAQKDETTFYGKFIKE